MLGTDRLNVALSRSWTFSPVVSQGSADISPAQAAYRRTGGGHLRAVPTVIVGSTWRWHCLPQDGPQLAIGPGLVDGSCVLIWGRGMADVVGDGTGLGLVPLVPVHVPEQHKVYSDELVSLLEDDERRKRVWNIALTGGYGSGKSSVLAGVRERLASRVVEISLSSLSDAGCSRSIDSAMR